MCLYYVLYFIIRSIMSTTASVAHDGRQIHFAVSRRAYQYNNMRKRQMYTTPQISKSFSDETHTHTQKHHNIIVLRTTRCHPVLRRSTVSDAGDYIPIITVIISLQFVITHRCPISLHARTTARIIYQSYQIGPQY